MNKWHRIKSRAQDRGVGSEAVGGVGEHPVGDVGRGLLGGDVDGAFGADAVAVLRGAPSEGVGVGVGDLDDALAPVIDLAGGPVHELEERVGGVDVAAGAEAGDFLLGLCDREALLGLGLGLG
ncbi:hypothetical protein [Terrabacter sp. NPDC080008]|uniref:hypothetical protein n=1 Tax=Terrabacter sp. NPDC080008 TaxID=3155176 RepID=UPI00344B23F2